MHQLLRNLSFTALTVCLSALLAAAPLHAQSADGQTAMLPEFGAFVNFNLNSHAVDFQQLSPDFPTCCPQFEEGSGSGFNAGILYSWPWASNFGLQARLGVHAPSGELLREEGTSVATLDGQLVDGTFEHSIDATLVSVGLEPLFEYQAFDGFSLYAGPMLAYRFVANFEQKEEIIQPDFGVFEDTQTRVRNSYADDIPNVETLDLGLTVGMSYDLPLNSTRRLLLAPEVMYTLGFGNVAKDLDWTVSALRVGVAFKWVRAAGPASAPVRRTPPQVPATDQPDVADNVPTTVNSERFEAPSAGLVVSALELNDNGREVERDLASISVEETLTDKMVPLLNYIFFDEGASELPARYTAQENSSDKLRRKSTLEIYHKILPMLAERLRANSGASLNLVGCNADTGAEQQNSELSGQRAQAVADFLISQYGVSAGQLNISSRNLPQVPSNSEDADGRAENRRVELTSDDPSILAPILLSDTLYRVSVPKIRLRPQAKTRRGVRSWELRLLQNDRELFSRTGEGAPDVFVDWQPSERGLKAIGQGDLRVQFNYTDKAGNAATAPEQVLPVEVVTLQRKRAEGIEDSRIDRFSLILFDFGSAELGARNSEIIELIQERITAESTVRIGGYTDRTGDAEFNADLSRRRAVSAANALGLANTVARGFGEDELLFNNSLPEGRFYCRTVEVEVETPIE